MEESHIPTVNDLRVSRVSCGGGCNAGGLTAGCVSRSNCVTFVGKKSSMTVRMVPRRIVDMSLVDWPSIHLVEPAEPKVKWVHPCTCTLVAHESCLLSWIQSAQQDSKRAVNALKCPQCGATYELESENPLSLRILNSLNSVLQLSGKAITVAGTACIVLSFGFGAYLIVNEYTRDSYSVARGLHCLHVVWCICAAGVHWQRIVSNYAHRLFAVLWKRCVPRVYRASTYRQSGGIFHSHL